ncbi:MAG: glycosyltransferase [Candidatus Yanofskybacteria bacterium]|nr:glycosyltransferase [Candidatus Yanofskybacteria bacterium]
MRILYFGVYDPSYARNWVLINGLRKNGVEVVELRKKPGHFALLKLFFDYLKFKQNYDVMVVGFPGQEVMFLAKLLAWRRPIVFDAFTSHYGGYILDRERWSKNSLRAKYFKFLDKWSCRLADVVLLDTNAHIGFFVKEFGLTKEKFRRIWIGANDENFKPIEGKSHEDNKFHLIFFGTYVPLQGAEYIVRAAKILESQEDIIFHFIGKGQDKPKSVSLAIELGLKNIEFVGMMKPEDLRVEIAKSDVVLGLFGNTPKTPIVIPNKVYEALAMKKPVITADTQAARELFDDGDMYLIPAANPEELAKTIIELKNNQNLRIKLSENGYKKFINHASSKVLGSQLREILFNQCLPKNPKF